MYHTVARSEGFCVGIADHQNLGKAGNTALEEIGLSTLQDRRERGDLITMFKLVNGIEKIDREDLVVKVEEQERRTRGHMKKLKKSQCLGDIKKYRFPHRTIEIWNNLKEEVVAAKSVHKFKEKLDIFGYGDRTY